MNSPESQFTKFPIGLRVAAIYLLVIGAWSLLSGLIGGGIHFAEFDAKPEAYRMGASARSVTLNALFIASGVGLLYRRAWARKLALGVLVVSTLYSAYAFAWGFAHGRPSRGTLLMAFVLVGAWNALWFILVWRKASAQALS